MRPVVLLTMAGRSERFGRAGVDVPKWSLVLGVAVCLNVPSIRSPPS